MRRPLAVGAWALGGAALITACATGALAIQARRDFDATNLQRPASEARSRVITYSTIAGVTGGVAVAAALAGWLLWPGAEEWQVGPIVGAGGSGAGLQAKW